MGELTLWLGAVLVAAVLLFALDRFLLRLEARGWIYYRKTKARPGGTVGNAFLELQQLTDPSVRHVLEERRAERGEQDQSGEPPEQPPE